MADLLHDVAIIGGGLGGCALAVALSGLNVPVTVYESRAVNSKVISSGVLLTPNGLRILDRLGILSRIKDRCYVPTHRVCKNDNDETTMAVRAGDAESNGFNYHRIWRSLLLDEMRLMLKERGVEIHYNSKFNGIVSDSTKGVEFQINGEVRKASLLVGSDGIHSTVRSSYIAPDVKLEYTGILAILGHIKRSSVAWPYPDYEKNATIQSTPGAIFWIAEDPEGEDLLVGKQSHYPEQSRDDHVKLQSDPDALASFFLDDYEGYGPTARKIIDSICAAKETLYPWSFMKMPKIPQWYSNTGRVILMGDGAHALPPSSGQGLNQALEDVYSLTLFLTSSRLTSGDGDGAGTAAADRTLIEALRYWQNMREARIDAVFDWTINGANVERLPEAERQKLLAEGKIANDVIEQMDWLYKVNIEEQVQAWLREREVMMSGKV